MIRNSKLELGVTLCILCMVMKFHKWLHSHVQCSLWFEYKNGTSIRIGIKKKKRNVFIVHNLHYATFQLDQKILKHWTHFRFGICWIWFWNIVWIHNRGKNREWVKTKEKRRVAYVLVHTSHIFGFGFNLWMRQMSSSSILGKKIP